MKNKTIFKDDVMCYINKDHRKIWTRKNIIKKCEKYTLCKDCDHYKPKRNEDNCGVLNILLKLCEDYNIKTPVFECIYFEKKRVRSHITCKNCGALNSKENKVCSFCNNNIGEN